MKYVIAGILGLAFLYLLFWNDFAKLYIKEGATGSMKINSGRSNSKDNDIYFTPRNDKINELSDVLSNIKSFTPITFATGTIDYDRIKTPIVKFTGDIPYIFINITLPYPLAGYQGDTGPKGEKGPRGPKGPSGDKGANGYVGSDFTPWVFSGK